MRQPAHLDFETRSVTDLKKSGVYRYAEDPTTWPWGFRYRFGDAGPVKEWRPGWADPIDLLQHVAEGGVVVCHNAAFERTIWNWVIRQRICPNWPPLRIEQQDCTMARAAVVALPQGLEQLGIALRLPFQKDMEGHAVMRKQMRPRRINEDGTITWWDELELTDRNMTYCGRDVETETEADRVVPPLTEKWRAVWEFDQVINERGVYVDLPFVSRATALVDYSKKQNDRVMRDITDRTVPKCSNDQKIIAWLNARGVACDSLAKGEVEDVIFMAQVASDDKAYDAIRLRQAAWKTSTAKYAAIQECVSSDSRVRGLLNFHGASTGRWAGRLVQPQNFPRVDPDDKNLQVKVRWMHELLGSGASIRDVYEYFATVHGPLEVLEVLSKCLRSAIMAAPDKKFVSGDFSNIEGRVNAWLANEAWKLQAFADYDAGTGPDLYRLAYARSFGVPVESVGKGPQRQIGKVQELALGYQGGIGAYLTMGATYGVNPFALSKPVSEATPAAQWDTTAARYHAPGTRTHGLFEKEWVALQVLVDNWRKANPNKVQAWWNYQDAAIEAVAAPGNVVHPKHTTRIAYYSDQRSLWCVLPSQRMLHYSSPEIVEERAEYYDAESGEMRARLRRKVVFEGTDSRTKQWTRQSLYGGLQCENIVQATSVDLLVDAMFRVEAAGYPVVLTVHDEILSEPDKHSTAHNAGHFAAIMAQKDPVYDGLPISVSAWEDTRYVK